MDDPQLLRYKGWFFRWRPALIESGRLLVLIHGWTGDENSMWTLARNLSHHYSILAPRGPYPAPRGGFSWRSAESKMNSTSSYEDLLPAANKLVHFIDEWTTTLGMETRSFDLAGFSQGAAMAYSIWSLIPSRIRRTAILSGFLPEGIAKFMARDRIENKKVFISHGRNDEMVPIEYARAAVEMLKNNGAQVMYCESEAAHKVSKECLQAMEKFLEQD
jgi:phospholipase/carboxylesterase